MKAHYQLAKHAIHEMGYTISVDNCESIDIRKSDNINAVMDEVENVDESTMIFHDENGKRVGAAFIVLGNDGGDEVSDYTCNADGSPHWIDTWFNKTVMGA